MVGIWGMGGAGKTTLAEHLFNKKSLTFARSCFVSDVREAARKEVLYEKQKELLDGLDLGTKHYFNNVDKGKEILTVRLRSVPVLIVLDDVDHTDQLDALLPERDSLGKESLIIVTTRELRVLKASGISAIYKIRALNASHAKELFSWHAFGQLFPLSGFEDLAQKFIDACQRLPLSLKVFGGLLRGEPDKKYWQSTLVEVSSIVPDDIKSRLRISYDALGEKEKQMFLDVACFFIGASSSRAIAVWDGSEWNGLHGWDRLVNKCLVELDKYTERIRMHDHLRDLGREIANQQSPYRLWSKKQVIKIQPQQVAVQVRGMTDAFLANCFVERGQITLNTNEGERSLQLGSLGLQILIGSGYFDRHWSELSKLKDLVYLQWEGFYLGNLPSLLPLKKLRILELFHPELPWRWERDARVQFPSALKVLSIHCERTSSGVIRSLNSLTSLEELRINQCEELDGLPHLRESISLRNIELARSDKLQNIEGLESLKSLETLEIKEFTELNTLPSLAELTFLKKIVLSSCHKLEKIVSFKGLKSLEELRINQCPQLDVLLDLGESISLRNIELTKCDKLLKIEGLESLKSLETLEINWCRKLNALPSLAELTSLIKIKWHFYDKLKKIDSLKSLTSLEELSIDECALLDGLPGLGELISLRKIELRRCGTLQKIEGLESVKSLETLTIDSCFKLNSLPSLTGLTFLKRIALKRCDKLEKIESLKGLTSLEVLRICGCRQLDGLPSLEESISLREIEVSCCHKLQKIEGLETLRLLKRMIITDCAEFNTLLNLSGLTSLVRLELIRCYKLEKIGGLDSLRSLKMLRIKDCPESGTLSSLVKLTSSEEFEMDKCWISLKYTNA